MSGHDEVREKLEVAQDFASCCRDDIGELDEDAEAAIAKISEALTLLESEQGLQTEALVGISKYPCINDLLGERTEEDDFCGCAACVAGYALRGKQILVRAILGTPTESTTP